MSKMEKISNSYIPHKGTYKCMNCNGLIPREQFFCGMCGSYYIKKISKTLRKKIENELGAFYEKISRY